MFLGLTEGRCLMPKNQSILENMSLDQVLGTIPSGLFVVNTDMHIVYWNPEAERITGFSAEEAVGQHCSFLQGVPCENSCGLFNSDIPKPIIGANCTVLTKSGDTINLLKNIEYLRDSEKNIIGGIESFIDITRLHSLEQSLREHAELLESRVEERTSDLKKSESRFRTMLDNMDDMAYIATEDYQLSFMNRSMLEMFGDQVGSYCYEVLHSITSPCAWCPMDRVFRNRTFRDERQLGQDGRLYEIIHSPLPAEEGFKQKLAVCRDITERKKVEQDLQEANRELDAFAHSISHDLRGILSPVITYMDFLSTVHADQFNEETLNILNEVEGQSKRAIALLDDLLDLARVSHIMPAEFPTNINKVITDILQDLELEHPSHPEVLVERLPQTWMPEPLVYQVFTNLLSNAFHYVSNDAGPIEVGCWEEPGNYVYFVRDYGPGVSYKERKEIFEIFYRGKTSKGHRGTGVGLAIVRKIALRCDGEVWVEQTPGGGATFCIAIPKNATSSMGKTEAAAY